MVLVFKLSNELIFNYRREVLECLKNSINNILFKKIIVFTENNELDFPKNNKIKYIIKNYDYDKIVKYMTDNYKTDFIFSSSIINLGFNDIKDIKEGLNVKNNKSYFLIKRENEIDNKTNILKAKFEPIGKNNKSRKLDVIIVCVNYSHVLKHTLEYNLKVFKNITVITHPEDRLTIHICNIMGVNIVKDVECVNVKLDKSKAINKGIQYLENPDFILVLDADIIVENEIDLDKLDKGSIYTSGRYVLNDIFDYEKKLYENKDLKKISVLEKNRGLGFFQLFNYSQKQKYPDSKSGRYSDNEWVDLIFKKSFIKIKYIGFDVMHIGKPNKIWEDIKYGNKDNKKVLVIIAAYNAEKTIRGSIESVINQKHQNFIISIIDDCSTDNTFDIIKEYSKKDKRIKIYKNNKNRGAYYSRNVGLYYNIDNVDYWTIHDADDEMLDNRLSRMLDYNDKYLAITCYLRRINGYTNEIVSTNKSGDHSNILYDKNVFEKIGYYDSNTRFAGDSEYSARFKNIFGNNKLIKISEFLFNAYNYDNNETLINPIGSKKRLDYVNNYKMRHKELKNELFMDFKPENNDKVFIGIASIPSREKTLEKTIKSLINQVHELGVYLNNWDYVPNYLKHDKIKIIKSQDEGDFGDAGKFYWVDNFSGYYFTCDDDIIYPDNYIKKTIDKIEKNKRSAVIGFHGSIIKDNFTNYYSSHSRDVYHFKNNIVSDTRVHILGTGTVGFHTSTINVNFKDFKTPNMADIYFAKLAQEQQVSFIVQNHKKEEMKSIESENNISKSSISKDNSKYDTSKLQNEVVKSINWNIN